MPVNGILAGKSKTEHHRNNPGRNGPDRIRPGLWNPAILLATWFGSGYLPRFPGTWGSLAALPFAWFIHQTAGAAGLAVAAIAVAAIGVWCSSVYMRLSGDEDPGPVVIDEVAGQWLTLAVVPPDLLFYAMGFVLFRLFDIVKPWPISWLDREVKGGVGVMLDDIAAAFCAAAVLYGIRITLGAG